MAIYRSIFAILERSRKSLIFDLVLNRQKNRKMSAKTAQGSENPPRAWAKYRVLWDQGPWAATRATRKWTLDCGKWTMDKRRWKMGKGKWQVTKSKWQVKEKW